MDLGAMAMKHLPKLQHYWSLPTDCLVSYTGHSLGESYPSAEMQSVYSVALAYWVMYQEVPRSVDVASGTLAQLYTLLQLYTVIYTLLYTLLHIHSCTGIQKATKLGGIMRYWWRCPWCNGYRHRIWTRQYEFNSWTRLIAFHIALIPLGKVWIQLFALQLWVNSRAD